MTWTFLKKKSVFHKARMDKKYESRKRIPLQWPPINFSPFYLANPCQPSATFYSYRWHSLRLLIFAAISWLVKELFQLVWCKCVRKLYSSSLLLFHFICLISWNAAFSISSSRRLQFVWTLISKQFLLNSIILSFYSQTMTSALERNWLFF